MWMLGLILPRFRNLRVVSEYNLLIKTWNKRSNKWRITSKLSINQMAIYQIEIKWMQTHKITMKNLMAIICSSRRIIRRKWKRDYMRYSKEEKNLMQNHYKSKWKPGLLRKLRKMFNSDKKWICSETYRKGENW